MSAAGVWKRCMDPPSLRICANRSASMFALLKDGADCCVNILDASQQAIAEHFAGGASGEARFSRGDWQRAVHGGWVLGESQASFTCLFDQAPFYSTPGIVIGGGVGVRLAGPGGPLISVAGGFRSLGEAAGIAGPRRDAPWYVLSYKLT